MKPVSSIFYTILFAAAIPFFAACTKQEETKTTKTTSKPVVINDSVAVVQDLQVRLEFGGIDHNTRSTAWSMSPYQTTQLIKFDKRNYPNVTSIIFTGSLYTSNAKNKCMVELYNVTDSVAIEGSALESNKTSFVFVDSENIYEQLPDKEIALAVRVKSEKKGVMVSTGARHMLFLNRD